MVNFRGSAVLPMDLLVASPSQEPISRAFIVSKPEHERTQQNQRWAETRDQWIAVAAAAVHVAAFAYNLAFWGSEGMPSDRYWPLEPRYVLLLQRALCHPVLIPCEQLACTSTMTEC